MTLAVTFALPAESADFLRLLDHPRRTGETFAGGLHGEAIAVLHTGVGAEIARLRLEKFLHAQPAVRCLVAAGFAGALDAQLQLGDLLLADNMGAPDLRARAQSILGHDLRHGPLASAAAVTDSPAERQEFARRSGAIAVDMESTSLSEVCRAARLPMLALRAITDTPARPMPAPPAVLFDVRRQRTPYAHLAWHLATHPAALPRLLTFAQTVAAARRRLTNSLAQLLRGLS